MKVQQRVEQVEYQVEQALILVDEFATILEQHFGVPRQLIEQAYDAASAPRMVA